MPLTCTCSWPPRTVTLTCSPAAVTAAQPRTADAEDEPAGYSSDSGMSRTIDRKLTPAGSAPHGRPGAAGSDAMRGVGTEGAALTPTYTKSPTPLKESCAPSSVTKCGSPTAPPAPRHEKPPVARTTPSQSSRTPDSRQHTRRGSWSANTWLSRAGLGAKRASDAEPDPARSSRPAAS